MAFTHAHAVCSSYGRGTLPKLIEPNKDIPLEMMVENYYKKKIGAEMSEETKSVLMDILGEDKEDK